MLTGFFIAQDVMMSEKKKRTFAFRFSIRFLLVLATLFSILFGLWAHYIHPIDRQWRAVEALEDENLDFQITKTEPAKLPSWMLFVLKEERRQNIVAASCSSPAKNPELFASLVFLRSLSLGSSTLFSEQQRRGRSEWKPSNTTAEFENQIKSISKLPRLRSVKLFCDRSDWWRSTEFFSQEVAVTVASDAFTIRSGEFPQFIKLLQNKRLEPRTGWAGFKYRNFQIEVESASDEDLALLESVLEHEFVEIPADPNWPPNWPPEPICKPIWEVRLSLNPQQVSKGATDFLFGTTAKEKLIKKIAFLKFFPANYQFDNTLRYTYFDRTNSTNLYRRVGKVPSFDLETWELVAPVLDKVGLLYIRNWGPGEPENPEHRLISMYLRFGLPSGGSTSTAANGISIVGDSSALGTAFKRLENVEEVKLSFHGDETRVGDDSFNSYLKTLSLLPSLKRLNLTVNQIDLPTEHAESLSRLGSLESISFHNFQNVSIPSKFFQPIAANCSNLKTLRVIGWDPSFDIEKSLRCFVDRPAINKISISVSNADFEWQPEKGPLKEMLDRYRGN